MSSPSDERFSPEQEGHVEMRGPSFSSIGGSMSSCFSLSSSVLNDPLLTPKGSGADEYTASGTPNSAMADGSPVSGVILSSPSPKQSSLKPFSSFIASPTAKGAATDSVKFVEDERGGSNRPQRTRRSTPIRLVSGIHGTVLPEYQGGLPKMGHTAVSYQQGVYVFGGVNAKGQYSNHVFFHEKRNLSWHEIRGVGVVPRGRANHAAVIVDTKIYVFGGHRHLDVFDDLFAYDISTSRWEKIGHEQTQGPGGVFLHCMIHIPSSDSLFVVGGVHHREQNSYLGHLFDIRNRVWSAVPPPPAVNPQHLQLVSAAYHEPSNSVVVLGLTENGVMQTDYTSTPCVYLFQMQSFAWRRVETPTAPESPLPFRIEAVWTEFLHLLITSGGGLYDPVLQLWLFPFPLSSSRKSASAAAAEAKGAHNQSSSALPPPPSNKLGFLVLNLREMSWSLVLCKFPSRLLAEVKVYNAAARQKMERNLAWSTGASSPTAALRHRSSSSSLRPGRSESGVLNLSGLSRATGAGNGAGGVFGQRPHRQNLSTSSSIGVSFGDEEEVSDPSSRTPGAAKNSGGASPSAPATSTVDLYRRLINFDGPEFMRKFVLVAVRDVPLKNGKLRPLQYIVQHGGLAEPTDYTMLAFKLKLTRIDALAATKQNGQPTDFARASAYRTHSGAASSVGGSVVGDGDESNYKFFQPMVDPEFLNDYFPPGTGSSRGGSAGGVRRLGGSVGARSAGPGGAGSDAFLSKPHNNAGEEEVGRSLGIFDGGQSPCTSFLPTLPSGRIPRNNHCFALQFTPENALHTERLLPYANIPVAVLQSPSDVHKWSKNYYVDHRRWLAERLSGALSEDRTLRRLRRIANTRSGQTTSTGGSGYRYSHNSSLSDDLSLSDTDSRIEPLLLLGSINNVGRGGRGGKKSSTMQALEDQLAIESAAAAVENRETVQRRVQDFFEERHLEPFVTEDVAQFPDLNRHGSDISNGRTKSNKGSWRHGLQAGAARLKNPKAVPATGTAGIKKGAGKVGAASALSPGPSSIVAAQMPPSFATIVGPVVAAKLGFQPVTAQPRHSLTWLRRGLCVSQGGADGNHNELARNISRLLMQNSLDRFRADDDSIETRKKKARLRWRFLRALVCTGEASYLMYRTSQVQSKMRGVPVSSTAGLVLAPELHLVGPSQAYRVPSKPVPYNVSNATGAVPALSATSASSYNFTQVTTSGMVLYGLHR
ncbi:hypothetical protein ABL78_5163 [Leptomonas seymouri]|uniref:Uncharacterized protein n=1 Tax=Leptomonas seymouri TaxID=5684 RepID=A0A0N1I5A7_LEPSE|nr:hypothetical protein ABL78_5163 [Leptomonas seymouri]|eukprot:KPI85772.1 hypothetical protein ABL78_5163 [Leptomonas seymouri]